MEKVIRDTQLIIIDATFGVLQKPHKQLLVIHAQVRKEGGTIINMPVAFAVMQNQSESAYQAVFEKVKELVEKDDTTGAHAMKVKRFMVDYEKAIWNALRAVWVGVTVRGCWFHFCQCIYRRARQEKVTHSLYNQHYSHKMVKRLMTLPLIDHKNIPHVFERLQLHYKDQINDSPGVKKLFEYVERQWIRGTRTGFVPKDYTNYKQKIRTTNIAECWNGKIYQAGGRKKHDIYQLTVLLARNAKKCEDNICHFSSSHYKRITQIQKDEKIKKAYAHYEQQERDKVEDRNWVLLENLRAATSKYINYVPGELAPVAGPLEN